MRCFILLIFLTAINLTALRSQNLSDYRWKNRLVLLVGQPNDSLLNAQQQIFKPVYKQVKERDLVILQLQNTALLKDQYKIKPNFKGVLLIGKDGGLKYKTSFTVQPQTIFTVIDGMPMRQAEMQKQYP